MEGAYHCSNKLVDAFYAKSQPQRGTGGHKASDLQAKQNTLQTRGVGL